MLTCDWLMTRHHKLWLGIFPGTPLWPFDLSWLGSSAWALFSASKFPNSCRFLIADCNNGRLEFAMTASISTWVGKNVFSVIRKVSKFPVLKLDFGKKFESFLLSIFGIYDNRNISEHICISASSYFWNLLANTLCSKSIHTFWKQRHQVVPWWRKRVKRWNGIKTLYALYNANDTS